MHSIELEKKLRLPDPAKVLEGAWKLLKRTKQQLDLPATRAVSTVGSTGQAVLERKRARLEADRRKSQGTSSFLRISVR